MLRSGPRSSASRRVSRISARARAMPARLGAARDFARAAQPAQKSGLDVKSLGKAVQPAQALAGVEDQIVEREMPEPFLHWQWVGRVPDGHHRAPQGLGALRL